MTTTWNPSDKGAGVTLSGGNLTASVGATADAVRATASTSTAPAKWYWEVTVGATYTGIHIGVVNATQSMTGSDIASTLNGLVLRAFTGAGAASITRNNANVATGITVPAGAVIGIAVDTAGGSVAFYVNNVLAATISGANVPTGPLYPAIGGNSGTTLSATADFGATTTIYTPPTGFSTIDIPLLNFAVTGAGGVQVGGSSPYSPTVGLATGSGGVLVGGSSAVASIIVPVFVGSGGAQIGGTADLQVTKATLYDISQDGQPRGGAIAGGAALVQDLIAYTPIGGAVAGGAAVVQDKIPFTASGGAVGGGVPDRSMVFSVAASGGGVGGGTATRSFAASVTPSGGAIAGGSATVSAVQVSVYVIPLPAGGAVAGGAATISDRQSFYQPSGGALAGGTAFAYALPAGFTPTAANPYADPFPGWNVNFETGAPARILGLPANALTQLRGVTYVSNAAGIFALDGKTDAGSPIRSRVLLPKDDAGSVHNKRVPAVWIAGEMERAMVMQVITSDDSESYHAVDPPDTGLRVTRVEPGKGIEGRFIQLGFGNVQGADFVIESIEAPLSILKRHGR